MSAGNVDLSRSAHPPLPIRRKSGGMPSELPSGAHGIRPVGETCEGCAVVISTDIFFQDARFEVLGSPYSLLSVTLSASQKLYTRRGTLVSVAGKVENVGSV
jgi:hypothetical protein